MAISDSPESNTEFTEDTEKRGGIILREATISDQDFGLTQHKVTKRPHSRTKTIPSGAMDGRGTLQFRFPNFDFGIWNFSRAGCQPVRLCRQA